MGIPCHNIMVNRCFACDAQYAIWHAWYLHDAPAPICSICNFNDYSIGAAAFLRQKKSPGRLTNLRADLS